MGKWALRVCMPSLSFFFFTRHRAPETVPTRQFNQVSDLIKPHTCHAFAMLRSARDVTRG